MSLAESAVGNYGIVRRFVEAYFNEFQNATIGAAI